MKKIPIFIAVILLCMGTAQAADWNFYGSSSVNTLVIETDKAGVQTQNFDQKLLATSRIGARVSVSEDVKGQFEYGSYQGNAIIRLLWGEWNFGAGSLGVGQHYTPLNMFYANQIYGDDNMLLYYGGIYSSRQPMVKFKFGNFQIAAIEPNKAFTDNGPTGSTTETKLPTIEAKYRITRDNWTVQIAGGYNTFNILNNGRSYGADAYVAAIGGKINIGRAFFRGNFYGGQNAGNLMWIDTNGIGGFDGQVAFDGTSVKDKDNIGYLLVAGYKFNDMFTFEGGYGYAISKEEGSDVEDDISSYYFQTSISLAPGVRIVPEIGVIDYQQAGQGDVTYYGAKWQIQF